VTWVLIWLVLVIAAVAVFAVLGLRLFRQAKALTAELVTASERLAAVSAALEEVEQAVTTRDAQPSERPEMARHRR
jgi:hypothetical protein